MYGISQRIVEKIILDYVNDNKLFEKLQDEIYEYLKKNIIGDVSEEFDSFQEISDWIETHKEEVNAIVELVKNKVNLEQIADMATKTWVNDEIDILKNTNNDLKTQIEQLQNELNQLKQNRLVISKIQ